MVNGHLENHGRSNPVETKASEHIIELEVNSLKNNYKEKKILPVIPSSNDEVYFSEYNLPMKYRELYLFDFETILEHRVIRRIKSFLVNFIEFLLDGKGIIFVGPVGTGKTALLTLMLKYSFMFFKNSEFWKFYIQKFHFKDTFTYSIYFWQSGKLIMDYFADKNTFHRIVETPVLGIDDITKVSQDIYKEVFDYIIRYREMNGLITFLSSQRPIHSIKKSQDLEEFFGVATTDILDGNFIELGVIGESMRGYNEKD